MRRRLTIGLLLCILAAWMQFLLPIAANSSEHSVDPFSIICAKPVPNAGKAPTPAAPSHHDHQHCLSCQAYLGAAPPAERPAFTAFDYPVASPLRWRLVDAGPRFNARDRILQPRGPPSLV